MSEFCCATSVISEKCQSKQSPHSAPLPAQAWNLCQCTAKAAGGIWITGLSREHSWHVWGHCSRCGLEGTSLRSKLQGAGGRNDHPT